MGAIWDLTHSVCVCARGVIYYGFGFGIILLFSFFFLPEASVGVATGGS